jgi:putative photosynthetic complex assembly protein 2
MNTTIGWAAGFAMLVWWFTTGIILFLDGLAPATFRRSMAGATVLGLGALYWLYASGADTSPAGAYTAFGAAIMLWGWLEMSFLMGFITGPRKQPYRGVRGGWRHFRQATGAIIYNELATLSAAALVFVATRHAANHVALWTFLVLWSMRLSAKLNLFLGVANTGSQFLPPHLAYLESFFNKRRMNLLFPISILGSTVVLVLLVQKLCVVEDGFEVTGYALTASLLALAILEHWFMVLPIPTEKLWDWGTRYAAHRRGPRAVAKSP